MACNPQIERDDLHFPAIDVEHDTLRPVMIEITTPEVEALINQRLQSGRFQDVEDVIFQALQSYPAASLNSEEQRREAIELKTFGKNHGLSLGGMTIRSRRREEGANLTGADASVSSGHYGFVSNARSRAIRASDRYFAETLP